MGSREEHEAKPPWTILLVGGSSGAGKTLLAQEIARHYDVSTLLVDDVRLALQRLTTPEQQPALHYFLRGPDVWQRSPEILRDGLIGVAEAMAPALATIMEHHIVVPGADPLVIEGDGILPGLAVRPSFRDPQLLSDRAVVRAIRSISLFEPDEEVVLQNMRERGRGFGAMSPSEQRTIARMSQLYGQWLQQEAEAYELPVLSSRPWDTLTQRALAAIEK